MDNRVEYLAHILSKLNSGESPEAVKAEAKEFIEGMDAEELSRAEQKLIDQGVTPETLRGLCTVHIEALKDKLTELKGLLRPGHMLHTLIEEHDVILGFLDQLEALNKQIQGMDNYEQAADIISALNHTAEHVLGAEKHHQREEDVLFPALEALGISGPPRIMRLEHNQLRPRKKELVEITAHVQDMDFADFKKRVNELVNFIVFNMRDHIFKENYILYPSAFQAIKDQRQWENMKQRCDEIGYCCFTPSH